MGSRAEDQFSEARASAFRSWGALFLLLVALCVSAAVQWEVGLADFEQQMPLRWGGAALLGAVALGVSSRVLGRRDEAPPPEGGRARASRAARAATWICLVALAAGLLLLYLDLRSPLGTALWGLGLLGSPLSLTWRERGASAPRPRSRAWAAAVLLLAVGALALRLYDIESIPAKYLDDEGAVSDWGLNYLHGTPFFGQHLSVAVPVFRNGTTAYPLPGSYVHALVMQFAGETIFGSRLTAAVAGALCVLVLYLLLRLEVSRSAAFAGAFLLALCHTHLYWSRSGIPQSMTVTAVAAVMGLTLSGLRSHRWSTFAWAGVVLGGAQFLYEGARFFAVVLTAFVLLRLVVERGFLRAHGLRLLAMAGFAAAVFAPIGFWYLANPYELVARSEAVFIFSQPGYLESRYPGLDTTGVVREQLRRALEGFAFRGDGSNFFSLRGPILDPMSRTLILTGILGTIGLRSRFRLLTALWIWIPIAIVCIPTVDPPSMTRLIQIVPALMVVAALVLDRVAEVARLAAGRAGVAVVGLAAGAGLLYAAQWDLEEFFVRYPREHVADAQTAGALLARSRGPNDKTFVVDGPYSVWSPAVRFVARGLAGAILPKEGLPIPEHGWRDGTVIVRPTAVDLLAAARRHYPEAVEEEHRDGKGEVLFHSFAVPAAALNREAPPEAPWRTAEAQFGRRGPDAGELAGPRALAVDGRGFVYVGDALNRRITVFDPAGEPAFDFAGPGGGAGEIGEVQGLTFLRDGTLLALAVNPMRLGRYDADGRWLGEVALEERLAAPVAIAPAPEGFYLLDGGRGELLRIGLGGEILARTGARGSGAGQFERPTGLASTPDGRVFVHDQGNRRLQRFSPALAFEGEWPLEVADLRQGQHMAVSPLDPERLYIASPEVGVLRRGAADGRPSWPVGERGDYPGQLAWPIAVAVDPRGRVYVWDENRAQVFRYDLSRNPALTLEN